MHFSRSCIVARICVTFNYPPSRFLALLMQLFNNKQSALFFTVFCTFFFSRFNVLFCLVLACSDRAVCPYLNTFGLCFFFPYFCLGDRGGRGVFGCVRIIVLAGKLMSVCSWVILISSSSVCRIFYS